MMRTDRVDTARDALVGSRSRGQLTHVSRANKFSFYIRWTNLFVEVFYECGNGVTSKFVRWPAAQFHTAK